MATSINNLSQINKFNWNRSNDFVFTVSSNILEASQIMGYFTTRFCYKKPINMSLNSFYLNGKYLILIGDDTNKTLTILAENRQQGIEILNCSIRLEQMKERVKFIDDILNDLENNPIN